MAYVALRDYYNGGMPLFLAGDKIEQVEPTNKKLFRRGSIRGRDVIFPSAFVQKEAQDSEIESSTEDDKQIADTQSTLEESPKPEASGVETKSQFPFAFQKFTSCQIIKPDTRSAKENVTLVIFNKNQVIGKLTIPVDKIVETFTNATRSGHSDNESKLLSRVQTVIHALIYTDIDSHSHIALPIYNIDTSLCRTKLQNMSGTEYLLSVSQYDKVERLRKEAVRLFEDSGIKLYHKGKRLKVEDFLYQYNIKNDDVVRVVIKSVGGGPEDKKLCLSVDLSKSTTQSGNGQLVPYEGEWSGFLPGLNFLGHCTNPECPSNGRWIYIHFFYSALEFFTEQNNSYQCPACKIIDVKVETFLVCAAQAKFHFQKCGQSNEEMRVIHAPSDSPYEYSMFAKENLLKDKQIQYDFIEVTTTQLGMSFNHCELCQRQISIEQEFITECGRAVHSDCVNGEEICRVCGATEYSIEMLDELLSSDQGKTVQVTVPSFITGNCQKKRFPGRRMSVIVPEDVQRRQFLQSDFKKPSIKRKLASPLKRFISKCQSFTKIRNTDTEPQRKFICKNLPALIKDTRVTSELTAKLIETETISASDEETLSACQDKHKQARELYAIIETRVDGIEDLCKALKYTKQSGALNTLSKFFASL